MKYIMTEEDIKKGRASSFENCPIALCIKRYWNKYSIDSDIVVSVGENNILIHKKWYKPSRRMKKFIKDIDYGKNPKPINFILKD